MRNNAPERGARQPDSVLPAAATGFLASLSLILPIGAQNAFVLRHGLMRAHVLPLVLFCAASDAVLISAGVAGFGLVAKQAPWLPTLMSIAGALFLLVYGALRLRAALAGEYAMALDGRTGSLSRTLATAAAITWLNPHVYLDTLALLGAISSGFEGSARVAFGAGAVMASFAFFVALGYGSAFLAPVMSSARAWRLLDFVIAAVMWTIAAGLLAPLIP